MPGQYYRKRCRERFCSCVAGVQCFIYVLILFINSNSNINGHVLLSLVETDLMRLQIILKKHVVLDCLLSWLQQRDNVVPAWIVVIPNWTTV